MTQIDRKSITESISSLQDVIKSDSSIDLVEKGAIIIGLGLIGGLVLDLNRIADAAERLVARHGASEADMQKQGQMRWNGL